MAIDHLLQEFPPVSTASWEEVIRRDLKGADYANKLIWQTAEGLAVKPYYRAEDIAGLEYPDAIPGAFPYARGARSIGDWRIREEIDAADPEEANREAHSAVLAGAGEIAYRNARFENAVDLEMLFANLEEIPVHFENAREPQFRLLMEWLKREQRRSQVSTGWNPFANLDFAAEVIAAAPSALVPFTIHGEEFEESGATAVEEVGFTLAAAIDTMAGMQERKVDANRAAASMAFSFSIGANFFFQIAKLRAFRMMWAHAVESFGGTRESAKAHIHARTSRWNETIYAPRVNILRGTTEAMSAVFGGADSITVAPFDECYKAPDEASRRLARNTQIILKQEALLSRVADPCAGSYYLEFITDYIARDGWKIMQRIEASGGYQKALANGLIAQALEKSLAAREEAVSSRRRIFTGTSQHANISEKALERIDFSRISDQQRGAQMYEQLRLRTERYAAQGGKNPHVLLAEIGDARMRSARAHFAANFFACAGFDLVAKRFSSSERIAASDADLIVLCSSDAEYLALAIEVMAKLKALGRKTPVIVAGYPDSAEQLQAAGVADFVHLRSNPIEFLTKWQQRLGIKD
ncbi:MAG: methylmalonyl-CoA mutase family protein [Terracidiphilus sp.]|jgi:methylmalonyl-CoA mutase